MRSDISNRMVSCVLALVISVACQPTHAEDGWSVTFHSGDADQDDDNCEDDDSSELILWGLAGLAAGVAATSPWWGPPAVIDDDGTAGYFQKYPYRKGGGYMELEGDENLRLRPFTLRIQSEFGSDFDEVTRYGANIHFEMSNRLGLDTEFHDFEQSSPGIADSLQVGDFNLIYRFAQSHHAQWWTGIGMNWLNNRQENDYGYNLTYGADVFIGKPWVFSGAVDYGKQGNEDFFRGRLSFGAQWKRLEVFLGYDYLNAGRTEVDTMMIGGRLWF